MSLPDCRPCRLGPIPRTITEHLHGDLRAIVAAALRACDPAALVARAIAAHPVPPAVPLSVVAAGKAAAPMADAFVGEYGGRIRERFVARGSHPLPDAASVDSAQRALALAREAKARGDLLVVLLSGGASAMLAAPAEGLTLDDKVTLTRYLLRSGLPIAAMNAIRKHVSAIKGGRLAAVAGSSVTYAISDVHAPVEDDPAVIGSGPTVADPSTYADALAAMRQPGSDTTFHAGFAAGGFDHVLQHLQRGIRGEIAETPKPGDPCLAHASFVLAGSRRDAMDGAAVEAQQLGYIVQRIHPPTLGDAAVAGRAFVEAAQAIVARVGRPACIIGSGETTVRLEGKIGIGGRNQELALAAALAMAPSGNVALASVGTDGIDGPTTAAGAIADATTIARAQARGLDASAALARHDSHPLFQALGDLVVTGPTGTNVGDLQVFIAGSSR
jgi:glycerate-2-kinase